MDIYRKKKGKNFVYMKKGSKITNEKVLEFIRKLVIPPAWINVMISSNKNDKVLCVGEDAKGRKQYKYNPKFIEEQTNNKYYNRLIKFGEIVNTIRNNVFKILRTRKWTLEKTVAFIIYIIDSCSLRVGNEKYKDENCSYGITTLEKRHIDIKTTSVYFNFVGKKSVDNSCKFTDSFMIRLFHSMNSEFKPKETDSFFKYYGQHDKVYGINSSHINEFLKKYGDISAKDFRTWAANIYIIKYLYNCVKNLEESNKIEDISERNCTMVVNKCLDLVSEKLNNTRAICKKSYICNDIFEDFKQDPMDFYNKIKKYGSKKSDYNSGLETILLKLLNEYKKNNK